MMGKEDEDCPVSTPYCQKRSEFSNSGKKMDKCLFFSSSKQAVCMYVVKNIKKISPAIVIPKT